MMKEKKKIFIFDIKGGWSEKPTIRWINNLVKNVSYSREKQGKLTFLVLYLIPI